MIRWKKSLLTLVPSPVLPVVGHKSFKNLLDKVTKYQSYLPVSKDKWNTQPQTGKRNPAQVNSSQQPILSASLATFPQCNTSLVLTVYDLLLQTDRRVLEGRSSPLLLAALMLLALGWAPSDGLLVDWCHGGMGWKGGWLIPAEEWGRQVQAWREWVPRMEWWC